MLTLLRSLKNGDVEVEGSWGWVNESGTGSGFYATQNHGRLEDNRLKRKLGRLMN
jgi:hypothetical protein